MVGECTKAFAFVGKQNRLKGSIPKKQHALLKHLPFCGYTIYRCYFLRVRKDKPFENQWEPLPIFSCTLCYSLCLESPLHKTLLLQGNQSETVA
jgi:hypothetical protein